MTASPEAPSLGHDQSANGRFTVVLIPAVQKELQQLQKFTSLSRTDLTNRAISLYKYVERLRHDGDQVMIRSGSTGELQALDFW